MPGTAVKIHALLVSSAPGFDWLEDDQPLAPVQSQG